MLEQTEFILKELGTRLLDWRKRGLTQGSWQGTQLKAEADQRAHEFLVQRLRQLSPGIPIISEEDASLHNEQRPEEYWLIDPIDGTASFCGGFNGYVTQVALIRDSKPVLAVVHGPALGLTYTATTDGPALCNKTPIFVTPPGTRAPILIDNYPEPRGIASLVYDNFGCKGYIESGSIGLKICRVADGTADLFIKDVIVRDWDLAPADLILSRSNGFLMTLSGEPIPYSKGFERIGLIASARKLSPLEIYNFGTQN